MATLFTRIDWAAVATSTMLALTGCAMNTSANEVVAPEAFSVESSDDERADGIVGKQIRFAPAPTGWLSGYEDRVEGTVKISSFSEQVAEIKSTPWVVSANDVVNGTTSVSITSDDVFTNPMAMVVMRQLWDANGNFTWRRARVGELAYVASLTVQRTELGDAYVCRASGYTADGQWREGIDVRATASASGHDADELCGSLARRQAVLNATENANGLAAAGDNRFVLYALPMESWLTLWGTYDYVINVTTGGASDAPEVIGLPVGPNNGA